jgi:hypothetical protein
MKLKRLNSLTKNILLGISSVVIIFSLGSCAKSFSFMTSSIVPAARGSVKVSRDKNKNYVIKVAIFNLAEVERLQTLKDTYVVWLVTDQDVTNNIGRLKSSTSLFSKQLKASLNTVSSVKPIKIFVTAEEDVNTQYPGTQVVLSTDKF